MNKNSKGIHSFQEKIKEKEDISSEEFYLLLEEGFKTLNVQPKEYCKLIGMNISSLNRWFQKRNAPATSKMRKNSLSFLTQTKNF